MIDLTSTFDKKAIKEILYCFDKSIDEEGYVIDSDNKRVLAMDGKGSKVNEIAGITNKGFIRNDIGSLIEFGDMVK